MRARDEDVVGVRAELGGDGGSDRAGEPRRHAEQVANNKAEIVEDDRARLEVIADGIRGFLAGPEAGQIHRKRRRDGCDAESGFHDTATVLPVRAAS